MQSSASSRCTDRKPVAAFDTRLRPLIDPPLERAARLIARTGVSANALTATGAFVALGAGAAVAAQSYGLALTRIIVNQLLDGIDGPLSRIRGSTDFGGYLDIVCDFIFYAAIPVGFGLADERNLQPALVLLGTFVAAGTSFLAYAIIATKRGMQTRAQGEKTFFYEAGFAEGAETIAAFVLACLMPGWFPVMAYVYAALCALTVLGRIASAYRRSRGAI